MTEFIHIQDLGKHFDAPHGLVKKIAAALRIAVEPPKKLHAVNGVSLDIRRGEIVGLVGESGCGKSTLGRLVAGLMEPSGGDISIDGLPLVHSGPNSIHRKVQMVFQNPYASLNPRLRIADTLTEAPVHHGLVPRKQAREHAAELLRSVGLDASYADRFPHQFSGGQRQRIAIARALAMQPELVVCDEAVSALDVSVQAQILNLFLELRQSRRLAYLFISHNLSVVEYLADRVAIMYLGRIVEVADTATLFNAPRHPYTQALIADAPRLDTRATAYRPIQGELPSPLDPPRGCPFHPRCPSVMDRCASELPPMAEVAVGHHAACHLHQPQVVHFIPSAKATKHAA